MDKLWRAPAAALPPGPALPLEEKPPGAMACSAFAQRTGKDLAVFLHGCAGWPVPATWLKAAQAPNQFATWPGLTPSLASKHLEKQTLTVVGHVASIRPGTQSTKRHRKPLQMENALLRKKLVEQGDGLHAAQVKVDEMSRAGSQCYSANQPVGGSAPPLVETLDQGATSRLGSNDNNTLQCQRALQEARAQSEQKDERIRKLEAQLNSSSLSSNGTQCTPATDVNHKDKDGNIWWQVIFYCYKCGCNWNHSSGNCTKKADGHKDAAAAANCMGGNTTGQGRLNWWVKLPKWVNGQRGRGGSEFKENKPE